MASFADAFSPEDRVQVKFTDFYELVKEASKAELMMNGIKNMVSHDAIYTMMTGEHLVVYEQEYDKEPQ